MGDLVFQEHAHIGLRASRPVRWNIGIRRPDGTVETIVTDWTQCGARCHVARLLPREDIAQVLSAVLHHPLPDEVRVGRLP